MGGDAIAFAHPPSGKWDAPQVVLLFAQGQRPDVSAIQRLSVTQGQFAVTLTGQTSEDDLVWCELLANGLTFDLSGLAPGKPACQVQEGHTFALGNDFDPASCEGVLVVPGPHLASGTPMVPVLRCLAWLAAQLAQLDDIVAVAWCPAHTISEPAYFRDIVWRWIGGGPFPGLGLTALLPLDDGGLQSEGLALFTGQELWLCPDPEGDQQQLAKLALRLLHWLVEAGRLDQTTSLTGPSGETLILEPNADRGIVKVWKGSR